MKFSIVIFLILTIFVFIAESKKCFFVTNAPVTTTQLSTKTTEVPTATETYTTTQILTTLPQTTESLTTTEATTTQILTTLPQTTESSTTTEATTTQILTTLPQTTESLTTTEATTTEILTTLPQTTESSTTTEATTTQILTTLPQTTESSTTTVAPKLVACHSWQDYNNDSAPETNGFLVGNSLINHSPFYIGMGSDGTNILPGRIQITTTDTGTNQKLPGLYAPWETEEYIPISKYLVVENGCNCTWMDNNIGFGQPGFVITNDKFCHYAFGLHTSANGEYAIARICTSRPKERGETLMQYYIDVNNTEKSEPLTQVLVCQKYIYV
ncbi:hypothetical protein PVAND_015876 [Polypedilum vanderplanki]|uniref:Uncharacterized protein n=1 Tax=Polypedilum vanderplanki TaxID=319348 RepID=A0A9J6BE66_POLVA|nr:hypothetical protein PVAND_015876 [Polypedilum vanderplanki]